MRGIHRRVLRDAEEGVYAKEKWWRSLRDPAQRGGVAGRGLSRRSAAGSILVDESGDEPVTTDAHWGIIGWRQDWGARRDLRGEYRALGGEDEQWEHE